MQPAATRIASAAVAIALSAGTPVSGAKAQPTRERVPAGRPIGVLIIPRLAEQLVVRQGVAASVLQYGPGHYPQTSLPGQAGTIAIAGHRVTHTRPFLHLTCCDAATRSRSSRATDASATASTR